MKLSPPLRVKPRLSNLADYSAMLSQPLFKPNRQQASIEEVMVQDTVTQYRFRDSVLNTMAFKELKKGKWYAVEVKLKNDLNYYVMNFQFFSDADIEYLKSFGGDE